jgi:hypothetical protein
MVSGGPRAVTTDNADWSIGSGDFEFPTNPAEAEFTAVCGSAFGGPTLGGSILGSAASAGTPATGSSPFSRRFEGALIDITYSASI